MKPSAYYNRIMRVMKERMKFTLLTRGCSDNLTDRASGKNKLPHNSLAA